MFEIAEADSNLLLKAVREGNAFLLLGAGTSATSTVGNREKVKLGKALAEILAEMSGLPYSNEPLPEVLESVLGARISQRQFSDLLIREYTKINPSKELNRLLKYSWRRVYTWNVDDALENAAAGVQVRRYLNGLADKVSSYEGIEYVQVIHLHGEALKPEHGFIFTQKEYNARLNENRHDWYRQAATDYAAHVPIFIGSRLEEPILSAELDRARPTPDSQLGLAFLITPDDFTPIQMAGFKARNIVVVKGVLADFTDWLEKNVGPQVTPSEINQATNLFATTLASRITPTRTEIDAARPIILHSWADTKEKSDALIGLSRSKAARAFLEGQPPSWTIAATDVPVWLSKTNELFQALIGSIKSRDRMFLVYGQSGSGKTTAVLQSVIKFMKTNDGYPIYELKQDVKSLRSSLDLIHKIHKDEHAIVYIGDAFLFSDSLEEDMLAFPAGSITLISSARSGEWRQHIERRVGDFTTSFEFQRFVAADYPGLIERLLQYVPAPTFRRMTQEQRVAKLASSNDQLLIALKETTTSEKFTKVIADEYRSLPDEDCRILFLIVGLATIARTGISKGAAREAFNRLRRNLSFEGALRQLEGIVNVNPSDRFVARHEIYVRHIFENAADFQSIISSFVETLRTYTKYNLPIVKNVGRLDGLLFKFILNHNFLGDISRRHNEVEEALKIYQTFEIEFQLDGHFWLQYGQYLAMFGELEPAMRVLQKSIAAYPDNTYAVHALADLQIRVAEQRDNYDSETAELLSDASRTLEGLHKGHFVDEDYYPIVTLAERYIGALIKHKQIRIATDAARRYFQILSEIPHQNDQMSRARTKLAHFITHGTWKSPSEGKTDDNVGKSKRKKRHKSGSRMGRQH
jgi:tetratricopeptide (TPR) repeat protein